MIRQTRHTDTRHDQCRSLSVRSIDMGRLPRSSLVSVVGLPGIINVNWVVAA